MVLHGYMVACTLSWMCEAIRVNVSTSQTVLTKEDVCDHMSYYVGITFLSMNVNT